MATYGNVFIINNDSQFWSEFEKNADKLIVVDFTASWCGPCQRIAPVFAELSNQYLKTAFLKVDVDICRGVASSFRIQAMPTFLFFLHGQRVDELKGADPSKLKEKILQWSFQSSLAPVDLERVKKGRLLECFRDLLDNPPNTFDSASKLLLRIANNIEANPNEQRYRALKRTTDTFQHKLLPVKGALDCLLAMGFENRNNEVVMDFDKSLDDLKILRDTILDERNKRDVILHSMQQTL